jgi:hypothetical protein
MSAVDPLVLNSTTGQLTSWIGRRGADYLNDTPLPESA